MEEAALFPACSRYWVKAPNVGCWQACVFEVYHNWILEAFIHPEKFEGWQFCLFERALKMVT